MKTIVIIVILLVSLLVWLTWEVKHAPEGEEIPYVGFVRTKK